MPGPRGCPVLSGGYDPLDPAELADPFPSYERLREEAPVSFNEAYGFYEVSRREDVLAVLRDTEHYSNSNIIPMPPPPEALRDRMPKYPFATSLVFLDDPEHRPARQMVQSPFVPRRLREMVPALRATAKGLLRPDDDPGRRIEFVRDYAMRLALSAIAAILDVPDRDFPYLDGAIAGAFRIASGVLDDDEVPALAQGQLEYWEYLQAMVEERRAHPGDDFASALAGYVNEDGSRPSTVEIAAHVNTILGAGFETSAQLMTFAVQSLLEHRDQWELLKADRSLLQQALEESIRYRTVIKRNFRVALADVEVGGVTIPEGALIAVLLASTNRDPVAFPDPDRFDITRKVDNLTFGRGMHFCLGAPLAKLELKVTLETLLDVAPDVHLVAGQQYDYRSDIRLDGLAHLWLDLGPVPAPRPEVPAVN
jgi:cytochrome P450